MMFLIKGIIMKSLVGLECATAISAAHDEERGDTPSFKEKEFGRPIIGCTPSGDTNGRR
jgi:hypothetical protein